MPANAATDAAKNSIPKFDLQHQGVARGSSACAPKFDTIVRVYGSGGNCPI